MRREKRRRVLIAEDDPTVQRYIRESLERYTSVEVRTAESAGQVMSFVKEQNWIPDILVLDLMMPYESAAEGLDQGEDVRQVDTGIKLLEHIRSGRISEVPKDLWVEVITARSDLMSLARTRRLLENRGRLYRKPFDDLLLEEDIARLLGLESKVPQVLLPREYSAPKSLDGFGTP